MLFSYIGGRWEGKVKRDIKELGMEDVIGFTWLGVGANGELL